MVVKKFCILFLVLFASLACQKRKGNPVIVDVPTAAPQSAGKTVEDKNGLSPSLYFVPILNVKNLECGSDQLQPIKNIQGDTIAQMCDGDYKICVQQGTCLLSEKGGLRMINFTTRRGKIPLFSDKIKRECPYGLGVKDICLDPYHTISADLSFYKLGEVIFIPSVRGMQLPGGETHDGYFIVRDSGSNLKSDKRFDFFTGFDSGDAADNIFKKLGLDDKENRFKFEKVSDEIASKVRMKRNYPKINRRQLQEATESLAKFRRH